MSIAIKARINELKERVEKLEAYVNEIHADALEALKLVREQQPKKPGPKPKAD